MKKIMLIIALFYFVQFNAQINCRRVEGEFIYVEFQIIEKNNYPIYMFGLCKQFDTNFFSRNDAISFVESFYKQNFYVPNIIFTWKEVANFCTDVGPINIFNRQIGKTLRKINKNNTGSFMKLDDGSVVKINICKIKGTFLIFDKKYINKFSNSNEYLTDTIQDDCYFPYIIEYAEKVKEK